MPRYTGASGLILPRLGPRRDLPYLTEFFESEAIDTDTWTTGTNGTGTIGIDTATYPGYVTVKGTGNANNDLSWIRGNRRWSVVSTGGNTIVRKLIMEFESIVPTGTSMSESWIGFTNVTPPASGLSQDNILGFHWYNDTRIWPLCRASDVGTEGSAIQNTGWLKLRFEFWGSTRVDYYSNNVYQETISTNIPQPFLMYPAFVVSSGGAGGPEIHISKWRVWYEDVQLPGGYE